MLSLHMKMNGFLGKQTDDIKNQKSQSKTIVSRKKKETDTKT